MSLLQTLRRSIINTPRILLKSISTSVQETSENVQENIIKHASSGIPFNLPRDTDIEHVKLRVADVPGGVPLEEVTSWFSAIGPVYAASWIRIARKNGAAAANPHRGFFSYKTAFISMPPTEGQAAIEKLHKSIFKGSKISVSEYVKRERPVAYMANQNDSTTF